MTHHNPESNPHVYPYETVPMPENWEDGEQPVHIVSFAAYRPELEDGKRGFELAAGNMNGLYGQPDMDELNLTAGEVKELDEDARLELAERRMEVAHGRLSRFLEVQGIPEEAVFIVKPQNHVDWAEGNPLSVTNVDEEPGEQITEGGVRKGEYRADMIVTRNSEQVLAITPADCPTLIGRAKDAEGKDVMWLSHAGWNGQEQGYVVDGLAHMRDEYGVDLTTAKFQIAAGGIEFGYSMSEEQMAEKLSNPIWEGDIQNIRPSEQEGKFDIEIDMFGALLTTLENEGVDIANQVNIDNTDTSRLDSGHSSHQRYASPNIAPELKQAFPSRDIVLAMSPQMAKESQTRATEQLKKDLAEQKQN